MACINMQQFVDMAKENVGLENIKTIVEVGALDGKDSEYFKSRIPHAKVVAIEGLEENFLENSPSGVEWKNYVISSYDGEVKFFVKQINGIHGMYDRGAIYGNEERIVKCYRLDSIIDFKIDMLKIDVEGATLDVFEGMGDLLDSVKIMHIETETVPYFKGQKMLHGGICQYLLDRGFSCISKAGARIQNGIQFDTVWIKI